MKQWTAIFSSPEGDISIVELQTPTAGEALENIRAEHNTAVEQIATECGLEPPEEFLRRTGKGRTTNMLLSALSTLKAGRKVQIVAYNQQWGRTLSNQLAAMARMLKIEHVKAHIYPPITFEDIERDDIIKLRELEGVVLFRDHYRT